MNYKFHLIGNISDKTFVEIIKLVMVTLEESDYLFEANSSFFNHPYSNIDICIDIQGSMRSNYQNIIVDFTGSFSNDIDNFVAETFTIEGKFQMLGEGLRQIEDINPSFIVGYLLDTNKKVELDAFKKGFY